MNTADRLFRDLLSAERSATAHQALADTIHHELEKLPAGTVTREVFTDAARKAAETAAEMEDDADSCRDAILSAGLTPDQYDAWLNRHGVTR